MFEATATTKNPLPESFSGVDCDQLYQGAAPRGNFEYVIVAYSLAGLYATINQMRAFNLISIGGDQFRGGDNPCKCGISTCLDGELCGTPPMVVAR